MIFRLFLSLALGLAAVQPLLAQAEADPAITEADKADVVRTLAEKLRANYVFPDIAERAADELIRRSKDGAWAQFETAKAFADALRSDLRELGNDRHLQVRYDPSFVEMSPGDSGGPSEEETAQMRREMASNAYGIQRVARLPGNIGYIDVRFFGPTEFVAPAYESAMRLLQGSDAIIVDLRSNGGGDPDSVAQLASHFFAQGDERHLNSIYSRIEDTTRDFWTVRSVESRFTGPVYVVTSDYTFSGGEEFAYDLQAQERATLVGETTGGGANPGAPLSLGHGFYAFIPTGRAINPITKTNWEHVGVVPEHSIEAERALQSAYAMALRKLSTSHDDSDRREKLESFAQPNSDAMQMVPDWKHPRE
ncbi:S41 family peptidase [Qipengyuania sp. XHP0207]|uniref:S41 family peptidase n=1 Tax=Qipengyuania sp. XHP0207 TaxID=3038078 RepID=UPI00241DA30B|nr:S41 family peptidase [Qipengyuania sp. XHP0207]MDG5748755.1 S41 family peptidase [Qipengyuania sp. XHP0207]